MSVASTDRRECSCHTPTLAHAVHATLRLYVRGRAVRCRNKPSRVVGLGTKVTSTQLDVVGCGRSRPVIRRRSAMHSNEPRSGFDLIMSKADVADVIQQCETQATRLIPSLANR